MELTCWHIRCSTYAFMRSSEFKESTYNIDSNTKPGNVIHLVLVLHNEIPTNEEKHLFVHEQRHV